METLSYGRHQLDEDDIDAVVEVLRGGALTAGPKVGEFEAAFAEKIGCSEAVVCSNGTTALHLAVLGLDLGPGDVAIVPAITFLSTANAVRMTGADVVFADVDPDTGLITEDTLAQAYARTNKPVKAVLPVHMNGQCVEMAGVQNMAAEHGSSVITDSCHALGADYVDGGRPGDGRFETLGCFSLHPVKSIAMGEGGMVTLNDKDLARRLRRLRSHDLRRSPDEWNNEKLAYDEHGNANPWYYEMQELGYNYRATDFQCALGMSQLRKLDGFIGRRREIAALYDEILPPLSPLVTPVARTTLAKPAWHLYPVLIDYDAAGQTRAEVMKALLAKGVGTQVHYIPVPWQPYYAEDWADVQFEGAARYYARVLSIPIFPAMTDDQVHGVKNALEQILLG